MLMKMATGCKALQNIVTLYVETLGIFVPQVYQEKEFMLKRTDGFLRRITKVTIEEMTFNKGFPSNFFDLNLEELE